MDRKQVRFLPASSQKQEPAEGSPAVYHVRARLRADLDENLLLAARLRKNIEEWPQADYRYRFIGSEADVAQVMACRASTLDYDNFKSKIGRTPDPKSKLHAYHEIWGVMAELQR